LNLTHEKLNFVFIEDNINQKIPVVIYYKFIIKISFF